MEQTISHGCGCAHNVEKPTDILSDEHRVIERVLGAVEKLTHLPVANVLDKWKEALVFFRQFADQCHHFKEEQVLFPALEEHGIPREGGPVGMMLLEHEGGREHVTAMIAAVDQLEAGDAAAGEALLSHARAYLTLLRDHIQKEDDILFRMADEVIPEHEQKEILKRFEAHEVEEMGAGAHQKYLKIAADLESAADSADAISMNVYEGPGKGVAMKTLMIIFISLVLFCANAPSYGASLYEGKTITIVVGYKPGGGYDRYARLIAKHLPKYIPGHPGAVVQNMPGASSVIAANHLFSLAKPDGLTIGTFNNATVVAQLIKVEGVRFDLTKFAWLGSAASDSVILSVRSDLPYKTADDLRKVKQFVIGTTGPGSSTHDFPALLDEFAGFDFKLVSGYSSSADVMLALERKEVDGRAGSYDSIKPFIDRGLVRPIIRNRTSAPGIEKLAVDENLATSQKGKLIMAVNAVPTQIYRPFVAPPGTAKDALKILRDAFANALKDKELLAEAEKGKMTIDYVSPEDAMKVIAEVLGQPPDVVQTLAKYIKFGD